MSSVAITKRIQIFRIIKTLKILLSLISSSPNSKWKPYKQEKWWGDYESLIINLENQYRNMTPKAKSPQFYRKIGKEIGNKRILKAERNKRNAGVIAFVVYTELLNPMQTKRLQILVEDQLEKLEQKQMKLKNEPDVIDSFTPKRGSPLFTRNALLFSIYVITLAFHSHMIGLTIIATILSSFASIGAILFLFDLYFVLNERPWWVETFPDSSIRYRILSSPDYYIILIVPILFIFLSCGYLLYSIYLLAQIFGDVVYASLTISISLPKLLERYADSRKRKHLQCPWCDSEPAQDRSSLDIHSLENHKVTIKEGVKIYTDNTRTSSIPGKRTTSSLFPIILLGTWYISYELLWFLKEGDIIRFLLLLGLDAALFAFQYAISIKLRSFREEYDAITKDKLILESAINYSRKIQRYTTWPKMVIAGILLSISGSYLGEELTLLLVPIIIWNTGPYLLLAAIFLRSRPIKLRRMQSEYDEIWSSGTIIRWVLVAYFSNLIVGTLSYLAGFDLIVIIFFGMFPPIVVMILWTMRITINVANVLSIDKNALQPISDESDPKIRGLFAIGSFLMFYASTGIILLLLRAFLFGNFNNLLINSLLFYNQGISLIVANLLVRYQTNAIVSTSICNRAFSKKKILLLFLVSYLTSFVLTIYLSNLDLPSSLSGILHLVLSGAFMAPWMVNLYKYGKMQEEENMKTQ